MHHQKLRQHNRAVRLPFGRHIGVATVLKSNTRQHGKLSARPETEKQDIRAGSFLSAQGLLEIKDTMVNCLFSLTRSRPQMLSSTSRTWANNLVTGKKKGGILQSMEFLQSKLW